MLKPEDFQTFGYTVGCPGCDQLQMGGSVRRNHTDACRNRIETELDKTEVGKDRLGRAKNRLDAKVVEMVEEIADGLRNSKDVSHEQQQTQGEMPPDATMSAEEVLLEEGPSESTETRVSKRGTREHYIGTPDRLRIEKRRGDPDDMEEDVNKNRRINSETEEGDNDDMMSKSLDSQPDTKLKQS